MQKYNSKYKSGLKDRCYNFSLKVVALSDNLPNKRSVWIIMDQLIRSANSIRTNIVEARISSSRLEFKKFYEISLKSANETLYWRGLLQDSGLAQAGVIESLSNEVQELANMLAVGVLT